MKFINTIFYCFAFQIFLFAQQTNIDTSKIKLKYSFLKDTVLYNGERFDVVYETNEDYSKTFKKNSGRYKASVLITTDNYYLYNEAALKKFLGKNYSNLPTGFEKTTLNDFNKNEFQIWFSKIQKSGVPYFDSEADKIYRDDYIYFRTNSLIETRDESTRIELDKSSNKFISTYSNGFYFDGYPIVIKDDLDQKMKTDTINYLFLTNSQNMVALLKYKIADEAFKIPEKDIKNRPHELKLKITGNFSLDGLKKIKVANSLHNIDFNNAIQNYISIEWESPRYKSNFVNAALELSYLVEISEVNNNFYLKTKDIKTQSCWQDFSNFCQSNFIDINNNDYKLKYDFRNISVNNTSETNILTQKIWLVKGMKMSTKNLFLTPFGCKPQNNKRLLSALSFVVSSGSLLTAFVTGALSQMNYSDYKSNINTFNDISLYTRANNLNKAAIISSSVYGLSFLFNATININYFVNGNKNIKIYNSRLKNEYPNGCKIVCY